MLILETNYTQHTDIQYYVKNNFITNYVNYTDSEYQIYFHHWLRWL